MDPGAKGFTLIRRIGGFFLIGGVMMFFDRAMYVPLYTCPFCRLIANQFQASNGKCMSLISILIPPLPTPNNLPPIPTDPLPNRPHHNNRTPKDRPLLRAETETQRHRGVFHGSFPDTDALGIHRVFNRVIWDLCVVWGFPRDDIGFWQEYSGGGILDWEDCG
jgi:hypothetical protein